jgi:hypothetical protein
LGEGLEVERVAFKDEGAKSVARSLLDVRSLVVDGEVFDTQFWGSLERVQMGLFTRLVGGGKLPTFVVFGVIRGCLFLKMRVNMLDNEVGASLLHS